MISMTNDFLRAKVFRDRLTLVEEWRVDCQDMGGKIEVTIFSGHNARERAISYAGGHYGEFEEIRALN